jgi:hypothetical protein
MMRKRDHCEKRATGNLRSSNCLAIFFFSLLPAVGLAQVAKPLPKALADSLRSTLADTVRINQSALADSTPRFPHRMGRADTSIVHKFVSPNTLFHMDTAATSTYLFQEFIHLASQNFPMIPILAGEVGQPRYWATGDLPPRAVQIAVDDIAWIPDVYGTADLTSLPDAHAQILTAGGAFSQDAAPLISPYRVHLTSDSLNFNVPFSRIEYAKGPFGADAVRFRFGRALGKRLSAYLNSAFNNSDGQFVDRTYEGHKANLQLDYFLTPYWKLRYRHLNSRNVAGISEPFFPEEWPGIAGASHKEERLYHALELSSVKSLRLRGFFWQVKEELNDPSRRIQHRLQDGGTELEWIKQTTASALQLKLRLGLEAIKSTSIADRDRFYERIFANWSRRLTPKTWFNFNGHFSYKPDWPTSAALQAQLLTQSNESLIWWLAVSIWKIPPALGERDNALSYLARNADLHAANLQRGEIGVKWRRRNFDLQFLLNGSLWRDGFIFRTNSFDSTGALFNNGKSKLVAATQLDLNWEFAPRWHLGATSAQTLNNLPRDYWFWHQPEGHSRVYLETLQNFFNGDLEILPRLAGRFVGKRYSPSFAADAVKLLDHHLPIAAVLDFQIRLRHGDGAFLFSWENVLNQQFNWRYGVPAVGRYLRWGFWWNFLN